MGRLDQNSTTATQKNQCETTLELQDTGVPNPIFQRTCDASGVLVSMGGDKCLPSRLLVGPLFNEKTLIAIWIFSWRLTDESRLTKITILTWSEHPPLCIDGI